MALDPDDPLVARYYRLREAALTVGPQYPEQLATLNELCTQTGTLLDQDQPEPATAKLDELEAILRRLGNSGGAPPSPDAGLEAKLNEALKKTKPLLEKAIGNYPDRKAELLAQVSKLQGQIRDRMYVDARTAIVEFGKLLQALAAAPNLPAGTSEPQGATTTNDILQRLKAMQGDIKQGLLGPQAGRIQSLVSAIKELLAKKESGQLAQAGQVLDELADALAAAAGKPPPSGSNRSSGVSLVRLGKARLEWIGIRNTAIQDIARLKSVIAEEYKDDVEQASQLSIALAMLDHKISELEASLPEELDAILNAEVEARTKLVGIARATMAKLQQFLTTDPVMLCIDDNEVIPGVFIRAPWKPNWKKFRWLSASYFAPFACGFLDPYTPGPRLVAAIFQ